MRSAITEDADQSCSRGSSMLRCESESNLRKTMGIKHNLAGIVQKFNTYDLFRLKFAVKSSQKLYIKYIVLTRSL